MDPAKQIAKESKSSFYYAFNLLPAGKRDAMNTVYAFCRKTDDIVDEQIDSDDIKYEKLRKWRIELEKAIYSSSSSYQLFNKLAEIIHQFKIPIEPFFELIKGMEMDLQKQRYLKFEDLSLYCYRVASTVGLMCIEIFGYKHKSAHEFAVNLGVAMQLTNILRDVKTDAENGRIYLPQEDISNFGYSENQIMKSEYNEHFFNLMEFEANRAKTYFRKANRYLSFEDKQSMFAARTMQHIYFRLLKKIESKKFDIYNENIRIPTTKKLAIAVGVWVKYGLVY